MNNTDPSEDERFLERAVPFLQHLTTERLARLELAFKAYTEGIAHIHRIVLLSAGVLGVVLPLLSTTPHLANPWHLRRAAIAFGVCVGLGVLLQFGSRYLFSGAIFWINRSLEDEAKLLGDMVADPTTRHEVSSALSKMTDAANKKAKRLIWLGLLPDLLFHGAFLVGVYYMLSGFWMFQP